MIAVTKEVFDDVLSRCAGIAEPETETDVEFSYETHFGPDGEEIAVASYRGGQAVGWMVAEHTIK